MFGKKKAAADRIPEDIVTLKPLFGLRPGLYLAVIYGIALLVAAFFLLLYPGLKNPGSMVTLRSEPWGAAVRIDDVYAGTTPCTVFVPAGNHTFTAVLPGFEDAAAPHSVKGRIFASRILPRRDALAFTLVRESPEAPFLAAARSFARWSFAGEGSAVYQIPMDLSEGAYRTGFGDYEDLLRASARFAVGGVALRDLVRATFLIDSAGIVPSPIPAVGSLRGALKYLETAPGGAAWLATVLPADAVSLLAESSWYRKEMDRAAAVAAAAVPAAEPGRSFTLAGLTFHEVPAARAVLKGTFPRAEVVSPFWIADAEVDPESFRRFTAEETAWSAAGKPALQAAGLAGDAYLERPSFPGYPAASESGVSWYAAQAYCSWLTKQLPSSMKGYEVRLPKEAEWEYAAANAASLRLNSMAGSLWEWCADNYAPLDFLPAPEAAKLAVGSPERPVRGGSWANASSVAGSAARGSLPPGSSSPFVGFRPVVAPAEGYK